MSLLQSPPHPDKPLSRRRCILSPLDHGAEGSNLLPQLGYLGSALAEGLKHLRPVALPRRVHPLPAPVAPGPRRYYISRAGCPVRAARLAVSRYRLDTAPFRSELPQSPLNIRHRISPTYPNSSILSELESSAKYLKITVDKRNKQE